MDVCLKSLSMFSIRLFSLCVMFFNFAVSMKVWRWCQCLEVRNNLTHRQTLIKSKKIKHLLPQRIAFGFPWLWHHLLVCGVVTVWPRFRSQFHQITWNMFGGCLKEQLEIPFRAIRIHWEGLSSQTSAKGFLIQDQLNMSKGQSSRCISLASRLLHRACLWLELARRCNDQRAMLWRRERECKSDSLSERCREDVGKT